MTIERGRMTKRENKETDTKREAGRHTQTHIARDFFG